jgi:putative membrane protein
MKMRWVTVAVMVAAVALAPAVMLAQTAAPPAADKKAERGPDKSKLSSGDQKFVKEAYESNLAEVELSKLATERGSNDTVKQFGQRMITDHTKANEELTKIAQEKGVSTPEGLDSKHKKLRDRLAKLSSSDFDRAYADEMVKEHRKAVKEFQREADKAKDPDVKSWASKTLPTLQDHLKQAQAMEAQVKGAKAEKK